MLKKRFLLTAAILALFSVSFAYAKLTVIDNLQGNAKNRYRSHKDHAIFPSERSKDYYKKILTLEIAQSLAFMNDIQNSFINGTPISQSTADIIAPFVRGGVSEKEIIKRVYQFNLNGDYNPRYVPYDHKAYFKGHYKNHAPYKTDLVKLIEAMNLFLLQYQAHHDVEIH